MIGKQILFKHCMNMGQSFSGAFGKYLYNLKINTGKSLSMLKIGKMGLPLFYLS